MERRLELDRTTSWYRIALDLDVWFDTWAPGVELPPELKLNGDKYRSESNQEGLCFEVDMSDEPKMYPGIVSIPHRSSPSLKV